MNLNHSQLYPFNNFHHLHPYPAKTPSSSRHHPPHHHSTINFTQNQLYNYNNNNQVSDLLANDTEPGSNVPLNRFYRNATSSLNLNSITSSASAFLLPTTTTISSLIKTTNLANSNNRSGNWMVSQWRPPNASVAIINTSPLQPPITVESTSDIVLQTDRADVFVGSESEANSHLWPTANDIPILIGAAAGGLVLLIVLIILLVIWNCCDTNCNGDSDRDNGSATRSNRSSLSAGSCGSSDSGHGNGTKRNSSSLYINNPNSLEAEQGGSNSPDALHYHYSNYDYGPGPGGGGVAQLVIQNNRVLTTAQQDAIPRSVSVPLSRSNSHKDSVSAKQSTQAQPLPSHFVVVPTPGTGYLPPPSSEPQVRSQLSQALTRNIGTYYEAQRKKNAKSKNGPSGGASGLATSSDKSSFILNDLSLNMDMVPCDGPQYGNVIVNNPSGQITTGQWILMQPNNQPQVDLEANSTQSEFYRTRSLPWSQSSRKFSGASAVSGPVESQSDSKSSIHSGTTTMGRVNFTKKRRNRMRNDSAAAIAINRSGFLGGSLDWELNGVGREESSEPSEAASGRPVATVPVLKPGSANPAQVSQSQATECNNNKNTTSPDSPDYMGGNESIVVYNERTAL